ncbi:PREDICTED: uncharacterized protein LOC109335524 [Lupinus angustifolius]|uniref:uncharacterized protein LOC109335524 n=1 Tax=Lupinus angustifolius TaxID=3871 RepID=UPI00092F85BE|nr:PREDICTED: uncharacterized protein LOC109335524 [Lupinus angustifolius]
MPLFVCKKLEVGELKPTTISLQLADKSVKFSIGILEDVTIKVEKFFILADFVILEMEENSQIPIILGRPFLATASAIIDVKNKRVQSKDSLERCIVDVDTSEIDKEVAKVIEFLNASPTFPHNSQDETLKVMPKSED